MVLSLNTFYLSKPEPFQGCLLALRQIIKDQETDVLEALKYGIPCFMVGKKAFCYLSIVKKTQEPYILFVEGNKMDHPLLELGDRKKMKIFRVDPNADLPVDIIDGLLKEAIGLIS